MTDNLAINPILLPPVGPGAMETWSQIWVDQWESQVPRDVQLEHLAQGIASIELKRPGIDLRWRYYLGEHDNTIMADDLAHLERHFGVSVATMFTNYCALLVNAPLARLTIAGWKGPQMHIDSAERIWDFNALDLESEEIHRHALVGGEAYVIVWYGTDSQGNTIPGKFDVTLQDERTMHMIYRTTRRNDPLVAVKCWQDGDRWRAILYYETEIVRLVTRQLGKNPQCPHDVNEFKRDPQDPGGPHTFGAVPVVRFARTFEGHSKLSDAIPVQDRINKLTADKIIAAEFGAYPQRYALTHETPPAKRARSGPGNILLLAPTTIDPQPGGNHEPAETKVGQFPTTPLGNYDETIQREVEAFFTLAELPRHLLVSPTAMMTGEAIKADEGPMVAAVQGYIKLFSAAWKQVMGLCGSKIDDVAWDSIEVHNEETQANVFSVLTQAGVPPRLAAEYALGWPQDMLDQLPAKPVLQPGAASLGSGGRNPNPVDASQQQQPQANQNDPTDQT